jgi:hypothetical protein
VLSVGETVTIIIEFSNPSAQSILYTMKAYAGAGNR